MVQEKQPKKCPKIDEYRLDLRKTRCENLTQKLLYPSYSLHLKPARILSEPLPNPLPDPCPNSYCCETDMRPCQRPSASHAITIV